jgi:hypothetical protein
MGVGVLGFAHRERNCARTRSQLDVVGAAVVDDHASCGQLAGDLVPTAYTSCCRPLVDSAIVVGRLNWFISFLVLSSQRSVSLRIVKAGGVQERISCSAVKNTLELCGFSGGAIAELESHPCSAPR